MVYAFVIHTLLPGPCRVLYHNVYGQDATYSDEVNDAEHKNHRRNDIQLIANEVSTEKRHCPSHLFHLILLLLRKVLLLSCLCFKNFKYWFFSKYWSHCQADSFITFIRIVSGFLIFSCFPRFIPSINFGELFSHEPWKMIFNAWEMMTRSQTLSSVAFDFQKAIPSQWKGSLFG